MIKSSVSKSYNGTMNYLIVPDRFWIFSQAEACKSFSQALKKCPSGMYAEIKYDGERVQVHCKNILQSLNNTVATTRSESDLKGCDETIPNL